MIGLSNLRHLSPLYAQAEVGEALQTIFKEVIDDVMMKLP